jgi:hypothetical protein
MHKLLSRRIVYSLIVVLVWLGFVVEGSHALFVSAATLTGNTITTGTAGLLVSNSQNPTTTLYADTRPGFSFNGVPGGSDTKFFFLKNNSSSTVSLDIDASAIVTDLTSDIPSSAYITFGALDSTGALMGQSIRVSLATLANEHVSLNTVIGPGAVQRYQMELTMDHAYASQGKVVNFDLVFTGTQHVD